ncbi:MAG TPA: hypothetical protein PKY59_10405 [Pyrinomonadaceae bacterium]|nr:hypothetical protein [Pyrinomonadaceae bacterium]
MKKILLGLAFFGLVFLCANNTFAQRKNVSSKEVNGTFKTADGANIVKVFSVGRGGLDNPGYNLQVEFFASLKLGPNGDARGNTGTLSGYAQIEGDTATFTPAGMEYENCTITMKFVKLNVLKIKQKGDCGFVNDMISTTGDYKKTSGAKPKFIED